ncbi:hypothetical protein [Hyphomicrobium zavarzinii]|jgi:hypothetical protein|uniref:hypothetical protein n=1 Tax=Hyphomicrobium zavarzinii TaxID=48292 RepID=UPI000373D427|nr:hypothetical protein [Hyphomicrobium zavarzinii]
MSNGTFPKLLTEIDELTLPQHSYLTAEDKCYFFGEYTARAGYAAGPTNDLIHNFKKGTDRKGKAEWKYKERSISEAAAALSKALNPKFLEKATLVPMPPSKGKGDPRYDDRLVRMLRQMDGADKLDIREVLLQTATREAAAHDGQRLGPDELGKLYVVDKGLVAPAPSAIGIFDDLLVTGASFVAAKRVLAAQFPNAKIYGIFLARRALPDPEQFFDIEF